MVSRIEKQEILINSVVFVFNCPFWYIVVKRTVAYFTVIVDKFGITNDRLDDWKKPITYSWNKVLRTFVSNDITRQKYKIINTSSPTFQITTLPHFQISITINCVKRIETQIFPSNNKQMARSKFDPCVHTYTVMENWFNSIFDFSNK